MIEPSRDSADGLGAYVRAQASAGTEAAPAGTEAQAYWWRDNPPFGAGRDIQNFGDRLTPLLLERFAGVRTEWAPPETADVVCVGSILEHLPLGWTGTVAGAGKLAEESRIDLRAARILALRGPLSARGIRGDYVVGDPGLLADELVGTATRRHPLGVVPHWSDSRLAMDPAFKIPGRMLIDPCADPLTVVRTIGECEAIVASSLHGIVLADAFGIPRQIEYCASFEHEGGMFKFRDHCAAVAVRFLTGRLQLAERDTVERRKRELRDVLSTLPLSHDKKYWRGDMWSPDG
jgi:Polysaccharide pyruvyl transferase